MSGFDVRLSQGLTATPPQRDGRRVEHGLAHGGSIAREWLLTASPRLAIPSVG